MKPITFSEISLPRPSAPSVIFEYSLSKKSEQPKNENAETNATKKTKKILTPFMGKL